MTPNLGIATDLAGEVQLRDTLIRLGNQANSDAREWEEGLRALDAVNPIEIFNLLAFAHRPHQSFSELLETHAMFRGAAIYAEQAPPGAVNDRITEVAASMMPPSAPSLDAPSSHELEGQVTEQLTRLSIRGSSDRLAESELIPALEQFHLELSATAGAAHSDAAAVRSDFDAQVEELAAGTPNAVNLLHRASRARARSIADSSRGQPLSAEARAELKSLMITIQACRLADRVRATRTEWRGTISRREGAREAAHEATREAAHGHQILVGGGVRKPPPCPKKTRRRITAGRTAGAAQAGNAPGGVGLFS